MIFPKKEMIQLYFLATGKLVSFCLIKKSFFFAKQKKKYSLRTKLSRAQTFLAA